MSTGSIWITLSDSSRGGCFRKCGFCVNRNYDRVCLHSLLEEFQDTERKKICLLDDNFLGHPKWEEML